MVIIAGGFFLGHGTPELKLMLREGDHCSWYKDIESCLTQCAYYLDNAAQRERIRREGQAFVREYHTFDQRITICSRARSSIIRPDVKPRGEQAFSDRSQSQETDARPPARSTTRCARRSAGCAR